MNARKALLAVGSAYAVWEAVDIFLIEVPAAAAVFSALFASSTVWFWRRDSRRAALALLVLCGFEAGVAPTLHVSAVTKVLDMTLGLIGVAAAVLVLVRARRTADRDVSDGKPLIDIELGS